MCHSLSLSLNHNTVILLNDILKESLAYDRGYEIKICPPTFSDDALSHQKRSKGKQVLKRAFQMIGLD